MKHQTREIYGDTGSIEENEVCEKLLMEMEMTETRAFRSALSFIFIVLTCSLLHWAKTRFTALSGQYSGLYCIQEIETVTTLKIEKPVLMKKTRSMERQTRNTIRWANDDDGFFTLSLYHLPQIARTNFCGV